MNDYIGKVMSLASKMRMNGDSIMEVAALENILLSLTPKFDYIVCSIEEANNVEEMQIDELQSSLLVHEQKVKLQAPEVEGKEEEAEVVGEAVEKEVEMLAGQQI